MIKYYFKPLLFMLPLVLISLLFTTSCNDDDDVECTTSTWYEDADSDGLGNSAVSQESCTQPTGYVSNNSDDDDTGGTTDCTNVDSYVIKDGGTDCNNTPTTASVYNTSVDGEIRSITFNFVPPHEVLGNVSANQMTWSVPANPTLADEITPVINESFDGSPGVLFAYRFGIATSGVPFDPVANEPWTNTSNGNVNYAWNLEVLSSNTDLVYDCANAHDPSRYHYHGTPFPYLEDLGDDGSGHSQLLGYAVDGFPIYYKYAYADPDDATSAITSLVSSYQLRSGCRPGDGVSAPDGGYDGTYVNDYEYVEGIGDLDECNGRWSKTPEFPDGTYVYYITDEFPSVPRCFKGTPSTDAEIIF